MQDLYLSKYAYINIYACFFKIVYFPHGIIIQTNELIYVSI